MGRDRSGTSMALVIPSNNSRCSGAEVGFEIKLIHMSCNDGSDIVHVSACQIRWPSQHYTRSWRNRRRHSSLTFAANSLILSPVLLPSLKSGPSSFADFGWLRTYTFSSHPTSPYSELCALNFEHRFPHRSRRLVINVFIS